MPQVMSFEEALEDAGETTPHLLMGNGFSIACRPSSFSYGRLLEEADFSNLSIDARELFNVLGTSDFERIITAVDYTHTLMQFYRPGDPDLVTELGEDASLLRDALAGVLAANHPNVWHDILDEEYRSARYFLANFTRLYTANYDLLLYWTLMQAHLGPQVNREDGFGVGDEPDANWVVWDSTRGPNPTVYFLHGGLHLYDVRGEIRKITWSRTQERLVDQIRANLAEDAYPLVVTEGTSVEKLSKIQHSAYLSRAYRSLANIGGSLFTYGVSFSENDDHLFQCLRTGQISSLYVSLYGDPDSKANRLVRQRAESIADSRRSNPLSVAFFDAESAAVWG